MFIIICWHFSYIHEKDVVWYSRLTQLDSCDLSIIVTYSINIDLSGILP